MTFDRALAVGGQRDGIARGREVLNDLERVIIIHYISFIPCFIDGHLAQCKKYLVT